MPRDFLPSRESNLVTWSGNFFVKISGSPTLFGLTVSQATAFGLLNSAFADAYTTANDPSTRSPMNIIAKNAAKDALIANARLLAGIVQKHPGTTDAMRSDLGLTVPDADPSPIPVPAESPMLEVVERLGTVVRVRLHDGSGSRRGKPAGVQGASVFSFVGEVPPADVVGWKFEGNTTRTVTDVEFAVTTEPGTTVWFTAFWYNPRGQSGPGCAPVSAIIAGGAMQQAA